MSKDDPQLSALQYLAMPVVVVSAQVGEEISCATTTSIYVALAPPMVVISLSPSSNTRRLLQQSGEFALSMLSVDQLRVAQLAGRNCKTKDKMSEFKIPIQPAPDGYTVPGVSGSLSVIWCKVDATQMASDHLLILGRVTNSVLGDSSAAPLIYYRSRYHGQGDALPNVDLGEHQT
jgi:flavin reductase (DIM6/NTAB) family NADH-FMN oxidoreductase RutF